MDFKTQATVFGDYDLIVAGGGPAGFGAAYAAARGGLNVLLLEANGCIGGISTAGNLPFMLGYTTGSIPFPKMLEQKLEYNKLPHPRKAVGGIFDLFIKKVKEENGGCGPCVMAQSDKYPGLDKLGCHDEFTFDIEIAKRVFDEMAKDVGLNVLYYSSALKLEMTNNQVKGVYFSNKSGIQFASCKAVVDCTGDADLVARAGYETYKGDKITGEMTSVNLVAHVENVDSGLLEKYLNQGGDPWMRPACEAARAENPNYDGPHNLIIFPMVQPGVYMINGGTGFSSIDGTDGKQLSDMTVWGRIRADYLVKEVFRKHIPGGSNCTLRSTAQMPGVRETRRIVGEYVLSEEDLLEGKKFYDTIALAGRHFDLSRHGKHNQPFADTDKSVKLGVAPIPYRALIPKGSDDVIVAGRCIAADGQALGPARIMSTCMAIGEAAGTAAIIKINKQESFRDVDIELLRQMLRDNNAEIDV